MQQPEPLKDYEGVSFHGTEYHVSDFVLYQSELTDGPGSIGQIVKFEFPLRESSNDPLVIVVRKLGRLTSLKAILPEDEIADEVSPQLFDRQFCLTMESLARTLLY